ncbi:unnamed protein product [Sphenostylis stenocarpa]|uniref:Uncharacterized protein n=1 Tax=Sphenostylis stenocarpa TaxID=92480 RepID=A0AA86VBA2_9FABA|nr:unnamed protein product [Sphenostylis stenocarpa]
MVQLNFECKMKKMVERELSKMVSAGKEQNFKAASSTISSREGNWRKVLWLAYVVADEVVEGGGTCEICHSVARNVCGANEETAQSLSDSNNGTAASTISTAAPETRRFWHGE